MLAVEAKPTTEGWECRVRVGNGAPASSHTVRVATGDLDRLGRPGETPEQLVSRAFEFLLARETASQILPSFALADISRYFPDFEREMSP